MTFRVKVPTYEKVGGRSIVQCCECGAVRKTWQTEPDKKGRIWWTGDPFFRRTVYVSVFRGDDEFGGYYCLDCMKKQRAKEREELGDRYIGDNKNKQNGGCE
jgi:hypothetical protein